MAPKKKKPKATAAKAAPAPSPPLRRVSQKRPSGPVPCPADSEVRASKAKKSDLSAGNEKAVAPVKRVKQNSRGDDDAIKALKQAGM